MSIRIGTGVSTEHDPLEAGTAAGQAAAVALGGAPADLALVFASGSHLVVPEAILEGVQASLAPGALVGCGAGGVLGEGRELEQGTGLAVWAAALDGGEATPFHATLVGEEPVYEVAGLPSLDGSSGVLLLSDPYSFPTDALLDTLAADAPAVPVLGGIASARTAAGDGALFFDEAVCDGGAVGVSLQGVEMLPCVSQGAAPVGRELTITAAEGNVIHELAGRPALETLQLIISELSPRERGLVAGGLLIGVVIDGGKPDYEQGDFLVRGVLGAESDSGGLVVGAQVAAGQVVRLHARDARSADDDLRRALSSAWRRSPANRRPARWSSPATVAGVPCSASPDHDAVAIERELRGAPAAGFFAAGEIGPVGGRSFLHGFTATLAVFPKGS